MKHQIKLCEEVNKIHLIDPDYIKLQQEKEENEIQAAIKMSLAIEVIIQSNRKRRRS